jgi:hypothetical protein
LKTLMSEGSTPHLHDAALRSEWADVLHRRLWETAPWTVAATIATMRAEQLAKKRGKPKPVEARLFNLPHQTQQRKAGLALVVTPDRASLDLTWSGANARLPQVFWQRPKAIDAVRLAAIGH